MTSYRTEGIIITTPNHVASINSVLKIFWWGTKRPKDVEPTETKPGNRKLMNGLSCRLVPGFWTPAMLLLLQTTVEVCVGLHWRWPGQGVVVTLVRRAGGPRSLELTKAVTAAVSVAAADAVCGSFCARCNCSCSRRAWHQQTRIHHNMYIYMDWMECARTTRVRVFSKMATPR